MIGDPIQNPPFSKSCARSEAARFRQATALRVIFGQRSLENGSKNLSVAFGRILDDSSSRSIGIPRAQDKFWDPAAMSNEQSAGPVSEPWRESRRLLIRPAGTFSSAEEEKDRAPVSVPRPIGWGEGGRGRVRGDPHCPLIAPNPFGCHNSMSVLP